MIIILCPLTVNDRANIPDLSDLNGALVANGLDKAVEAFKGTINTNLLLYHVLGSTVFSTDLKEGDNKVPTLDEKNDELDVIANKTGVFVKDLENRVGQVFAANIAGVNGVVHLIDIVLSPVPV